MDKLLFQTWAAIVALLVVSTLIPLLGLGSWFWPVSGLVLVITIVYLGHRFFRLLSQRCRECRSLHVTKVIRMRQPDRMPIGLTVECEIAVICHNPFCSLCGKDQQVRVYPRRFNCIERWWRRLKGEKFP
ncbi:MAG: hypothetical protein A3D52_01180 [Candidatus Taylorbacteria bacterium RIFCSPHIGHO2_02_FULL_44_36]|nr:MAG: hypothetical protein A3D52_01180 [Candidatus Taylorbacteria bacterium RIFCSPHIGHO2_02_FULL_44_36]